MPTRKPPDRIWRSIEADSFVGSGWKGQDWLCAESCCNDPAKQDLWTCNQSQGWRTHSEFVSFLSLTGDIQTVGMDAKRAARGHSKLSNPGTSAALELSSLKLMSGVWGVRAWGSDISGDPARWRLWDLSSFSGYVPSISWSFLYPRSQESSVSLPWSMSGWNPWSSPAQAGKPLIPSFPKPGPPLPTWRTCPG